MTQRIESKIGRNILLYLGLCVPFFLTACSTYNSLTSRFAQHITPYRVTIVQGNFVSKETAQQLKVGMTPLEVRALLGTPLLADMFHKNRWDYIFYFKRGSTAVVEERKLTVLFENDHLVSWSGNENLPSENDLIALIDGDRRYQKNKAKKSKAVVEEAKTIDTEKSTNNDNVALNVTPNQTPLASKNNNTSVTAQKINQADNQRAANAANIALTAPNKENVISEAPRRNTMPPVITEGPKPMVNSPSDAIIHFAPEHPKLPGDQTPLLSAPPTIDSGS